MQKEKEVPSYLLTRCTIYPVLETLYSAYSFVFAYLLGFVGALALAAQAEPAGGRWPEGVRWTLAATILVVPAVLAYFVVSGPLPCDPPGC